MDIEKAKKLIKELIDGVEKYGYDFTVEESVVINKNEYKAIKVLLNELDKKDKIINEMAEIIEECRQNDCLESDEIDLSEIAGKDRIIDYFTKKVEGK